LTASIQAHLDKMVRTRDSYNNQLATLDAGSKVVASAVFTKEELTAKIEKWRDELNVILAHYARV